MGQSRVRLCAVAALLISPAAFASSTGITGVSGNPSASHGSSATCAGCHNANAFAGGSAAITSGLGYMVPPNGSRVFTIALSGSSAAGSGFNISVGNDFGTLTASGGSTQKIGTEVTHTTPQSVSGGVASWTTTYNAPSTTGNETLYVCINQVNLDANSTGDGPPRCATRLITINAAPTANTDSPTVAEDSGATVFNVRSNDFSGNGANDSPDSISVTAVTQPANGTSAVSGGGTTVTYTPNANFNGSDSFTYTIQDSFGSTDIGTVNVTVTAVNDPPTTTNTFNATPNYVENAAPMVIDAAVTASDIDSAQLNQATVQLTTNYQNGQDVLACPASLPAPIACAFTPANGTLTISGVQTLANYSTVLSGVTYWNNSDNPSTLTRTVSLVVRDTGNLSSTADTTTLTVQAVNDPPTVVNDSAGISKNSSNNDIAVLANDSDAEGSSLTITLVGSPSHGSASITGSVPNQSILYTPTLNYSGADSFTYTVSDGTATSVGTVNVTVSAGSAPVGVDDPQTVTEDSSANDFDVLANDTDADAGDTKTVTQVNGSGAFPVTVTHGSVNRTNANPDNHLLYTPAANYCGSDSFTYTVADAANLTGTATVTVTVNCVNDPPVAVADSYSTSEDTALVRNAATGVRANDTDVDNATNTLTIAKLTDPQHGTLALASDGSFTYTPAANYNGSDSFTYTVSDGSLTDTGTVTLTITAVNDPPQITSSAVTTATDGQPYTYNVTATDVDDAVDGTNVTFGLSGQPAGMAISNSPGTVGQITWTPACADYAQFTNGYSAGPITVSAADGGENGALPATQQFTITVSVPDTDGDGMPDCYETANGFNPNNAADGAQDFDHDGVSNAAEFAAGTNPKLDDVPPVVHAPPDLVVPATGYLTIVDLGTATATDGKDGVLTPTSNWTVPVVRPGRYTVTWTATDLSGNTATANQQVDVLPLADFGVDQVSGEGQVRNVIVTLNGASPGCPGTPAKIDYSVGGTAGASDSDATSGTAQVDCTTGTASIPVSIVNDGMTEPDETVVFTITGAIGAAPGSRTTSTITITDANAAPSVSLAAQQTGFPRFVAYDGCGAMTITATGTDPNNDALTYDWSGSDAALNLVPSGNTATFDPSTGTPAPGTYTVRVQVSDGNGGMTTASALVRVEAGTSSEVDIDSDGIEDSTDTITDYSSVLPNQSGAPSNARLLEADPGLSLRKGRTAIAADRTGAMVSMSDIVTYGIGAGGIAYGADSFDNLGGIFDFEVHDLAPGGIVRVVLPLQTALLSGAVYRKFDPATGWHDFVSDASNAVASAASAYGQCPGPESTQYVAGLQPFTDCVRLTLQDGGPNDADHVADGVVRDPGGAALAPGAIGGTHPPAAVSGGAFHALWLLAVALLRFARRRGAVLAALLFSVPALAGEGSFTRYSGELSSGYDTNVGNAEAERDVRESGTVSGSVNAEYLTEPTLYSTLVVRGTLAAEHYASFDKLSNGKATGMVRYMFRADGDFTTPAWAMWASASYWEFGSAIRDSNEYRAGAFVTRNITTQISGRLNAGYVYRDSASRVFDTKGASVSFNLDWRPLPDYTVYGGYQFYRGGVVSTATTPGPLKIILAAEAIEPDDAFGGAAANQFAYRLNARSHITTMGVNRPLSRRWSVDLQGQYIYTLADEDNAYRRLVGVLSLLARF